MFVVKIPEFSNPSVFMRDPEKVQETMQRMVKAGSNTLQVVQEEQFNMYTRTHARTVCIYLKSFH